MAGVRSLLRLRKKIKREKPPYFRPFYYARKALKRIKDSWRKPRGRRNKVRLKLKGRQPMVETGYGSPRAVRGLLRNGLRPVLVHNVEELMKINKEEECAIIAGTVGKKKRLQIIKKAQEMGIVIANLREEEKKLLQQVSSN